ncbi:MAG TPA: hypothetical protein VGE93_23675, partial [Bryobacteraceae bacterium]
SYAVVSPADLVGAGYVIPATGGQPKRLGSDLSAAADPAWSPDSKHLLVFAAPQHRFVWKEADWSLVSTDGTPSRPTGDFHALQQQGFSLGFDRMPRLSEWSNHSITFAAGFGDTTNIWRAPVSRNGRITGRAERLTSGTALEISSAGTPTGELLFASLNRTFAVWSLPADTDHAKVAGDLKMITAGASDVLPSISTDGRMLAYTAAHSRSRAGGQLPWLEEAAELQVRTKDLSTGKEAVLSDKAAPLWHPQISRDGSMIAYNSSKPGSLYVAPVSGESPRRIVDAKNMLPCLFAWDWSLDERHLLFNSTDAKVHSVDVQSGREKVLLERPDFGLFQAKFSPNDQAIALVGCRPYRPGGSECEIFIVPRENGLPAPADHWIAIDHPSRWDDKPRWSPDGSLIYFISDRDGYICLWAQRFDARAKALIGAAFPVYHFHNARLSMANVDAGILEIGVAKDKIVVGLGELTGNIWSMSRKSKY